MKRDWSRQRKLWYDIQDLLHGGSGADLERLYDLPWRTGVKMTSHGGQRGRGAKGFRDNFEAARGVIKLSLTPFFNPVIVDLERFKTMRRLMPQSLHLAEEKVQEVKRLMIDGSEFYAFQAMELANKGHGESQLRLSMYYIWARLKEEGILGEVDTDGALEDFTFLAQHDGDFRGEGLIGRARMLYRKNPEKNCDEILALCEQAVDLDASAAAMMLMGVVFEHNKSDFRSASKWYLRAYRRGQLWGLRFYTYMQFKRKKFLVSTLASAVLAVTSPLMIKIYGESAPFKT